MRPNRFLFRAAFSASSPWVLSCGGTRITVSGGAITSEVVWNDGSDGATGCGVRNIFPLPIWQRKAKIPLSKNGVSGRNVGYINPMLYSHIGLEGVLRNVTNGNNSTEVSTRYSACPGWNACTGWGSPDGGNLLKAFRSLRPSTH